MVAPVVIGAATAWAEEHAFSLGLFALALAGSVCLLFAANAVDDAYDYLSGTDGVSDRMFPPDAPGWKPIPRGTLSLGEALRVSYALYGLAILVGVVLSLMVGWLALLIALPGIVMSYFYTAPPVRLDYRGLGLGEVSVMLSFGPIPALGAYYVLTRTVSLVPVLVALPTGLLTAGILVSHDLIFFDAYKETGKRSAAVVLGKRKGAVLSTLLASAAYFLLVALLLERVVPISGAIALGALPLFAKVADFKGRERSPPEYGSRTALVFAHACTFSLLLAVGLAIA